MSSKVIDLLEERENLSLAVIEGDKGAKAKLEAVEKKIEEAKRERERFTLAETAKRRRAEAEAQAKALADQEEAKARYTESLEALLKLSLKIEGQLEKLVESMKEHKKLSDKAFSDSATWGQPDHKLRRSDAVVNAIHDHFGSVWPDDFIRRVSKIRSLSEPHEKRLAGVKNPNRKPALARATITPEPKTHLFSPVRTVVEIARGTFTAHDDPSVRDALSEDASKNGRGVFVGGHQHEVTAFQADRLRLQGFGEFISPIDTEGDAA